MTTDPALRGLIGAVQHNCHIADAHHAADLPLCIYLLQMRESYRWELGLPGGAPLPREALGAWLAEREALWATLEAQPLAALRCDGRDVDAFDVAAVNAWLRPHGLAYGAGLAGPRRPTFFVADLLHSNLRDADGAGVLLQVCGTEHARTVLAPPAALTGEHTIVLRQEALARWLWEKFEGWAVRRGDGAFAQLLRLHGLTDAADFDAALPRLVDELGETLVLHELGEHRAGGWLGPGWGALRLALPSRRGDLHARAVRDHLADLAVTLPTLLGRADAASIHFWFANFEGVRAALFPSLALAYDAWRGGDSGRALRHAAAVGTEHFTRLARQALDLHARRTTQSGAAIERLLTAPEAVCRE